MSALGTALNTEEGRKAFEMFAEDSVRMRIRKRWERRREETSEPRHARAMSAKGLPIPIVTAQGLRSVREAIDGDGVPPEQPGENIRARRFKTSVRRALIHLCR